MQNRPAVVHGFWGFGSAWSRPQTQASNRAHLPAEPSAMSIAPYLSSTSARWGRALAVFGLALAPLLTASPSMAQDITSPRTAPIYPHDAPPPDTHSDGAGAAASPAKSPKADAPAAKPERRARHGGFFLRAAAGAGYSFGEEEVSVNARAAPSTSAQGLGASLHLTLGGSLRPGLVLGGTLTLFEAPKTSRSWDEPYHQDGVTYEFEREVVVPTRLSMHGPSFTYYPNPQKGLSFAITAGFARVTFRQGEDTLTQRGIRASTKTYPDHGEGFGAEINAGYEALVSKHLSLGGLLSLTYFHVETDRPDKTELTTFIPSLRLVGTLY